MGISTHSLTKRLTIMVQYVFMAIIFQLTASRRGWQKQNSRGQSSSLFQLTASRRGWRITAMNYDDKIYISTHSLTKRLTLASQFSGRTAAFQLTASRRGWQPEERQDDIRQHFNSQPHEEADWRIAPCVATHKYFNSQPHEEADDTAVYAV